MLRRTVTSICKHKLTFISSQQYGNKEIKFSGNGLSAWEYFKLGVGLTKTRFRERDIVASGSRLYAIAAEYPEFSTYLSYFKLPDCYQTWFTMMCIHVWMIGLRLEDEGLEGRIAKCSMFNMLYNDMKKRGKKFSPDKEHQFINFQTSQMLYLMVGLDESIVKSSDFLLADVIWTNVMFQFSEIKDSEVNLVEKMVVYIIKQLAHLNTLNSEMFLKSGEISFLPIEGETLNKSYAKERISYCISRPDDVVSQ